MRAGKYLKQQTVVVCLSIVMLAACSKEAAETRDSTSTRPNIVFVLVDDLRRDELYDLAQNPY